MPDIRDTTTIPLNAMANPPFGGKERKQTQQKFPIKTAFLFRQHFIKMPNENDLAEFVKLQKKKAKSDNSWAVNAKDVDPTSFDLSVKNPNRNDEVVLREPEEILDEIQALDEEAAGILETIRGLV